jgi:hypothetical protein
MKAAAFGLLFALLASPGPLDRNGGHLDPVTSDYHLHAGPSHQFRYVDENGRIWTGNGPRPEENLLSDPDDAIWHTPLVPTIIIVSLLLAGMLFYMEFKLKRWHRHRLRKVKR